MLRSKTSFNLLAFAIKNYSDVASLTTCSTVPLFHINALPLVLSPVSYGSR